MFETVDSPAREFFPIITVIEVSTFSVLFYEYNYARLSLSVRNLSRNVDFNVNWCNRLFASHPKYKNFNLMFNLAVLTLT